MLGSGHSPREEFPERHCPNPFSSTFDGIRGTVPRRCPWWFIVPLFSLCMGEERYASGCLQESFHEDGVGRGHGVECTWPVRTRSTGGVEATTGGSLSRSRDDVHEVPEETGIIIFFFTVCRRRRSPSRKPTRTWNWDADRRIAAGHGSHFAEGHMNGLDGADGQNSAVRNVGSVMILGVSDSCSVIAQGVRQVRGVGQGREIP